MEWYCIKTYGNGNIDAVTYRAYDPTGKAFVPFSWETEGGDPNSMLSTAMTYNLFQDPCNAFAEYNGDIEPPAPAPPAPTKPVTCDPKNPVNPNFDCTQKVGPGSKCQTQITDMKFGVDISIYQCTKLAGHHHRSLETANPVLSASESSPISFAVYIAIKKGDSRCSPNCVVGFLDESWPPISKKELNGGECVLVDEFIPDDGYYVNYYIDTPNGMEYSAANCANIGNENNDKCGLPNLPGLRACVIYIHI